ncbi:MAG: cbb3-type cytochrome c oxidase subunit I [Planctomycetes bacterium]|nr:cbb3-type cytochrome c oxidase subunit I [Planctomycetota bacterium]
MGNTYSIDTVSAGHVNYARVRLWLATSFFWFAAALLAGYAYSLQFIRNYPFAGIEWLSPGRVRVTHTSGVAFGFLVTATIGLMEYVIPKLTNRPVLSQKVGWLALIVWNLIILTTVIGYLFFGQMQAIEWGETPTWIDPVVLLALAIVAVNNVLGPILKFSLESGRGLYVSLWYFTAAFVWTAINYFVGNFLPQYWVPGSAGASLTSMYIHDLVGLYVTPVGWGLMYYLVPVVLQKPIFSHKVSLLGFWALAFLYPLNGAHHYLFSPIPMWVQSLSIVSSVGVHLVVYTVIYNFLQTLRQGGTDSYTKLPLRWFVAGAISYLLTCMQCALHVTLTVQEHVHFTDWVVGHAHFVMFGTFSFFVFGFVTYLWPRLWGKSGWWSDSLNHWAFWMMAIGNFVMWTSLMIGGLIQGASWMALEPFTKSITASEPYWVTRSITGVGILLGYSFFAVNLYKTATTRGEKAPAMARPALAM